MEGLRHCFVRHDKADVAATLFVSPWFFVAAGAVFVARLAAGVVVRARSATNSRQRVL